MSEFGEDFRKLFFAGVGMVSEACDCTKEQLEKLTRKGSEFLDEHGEKSKKWFEDMVRKGREVMGASDVENEPLHRSEREDLSERLKEMSAEELAELKKEIDRLTEEKNEK